MNKQPTTEAFAVMIPARLASTRLPHKALADLGGKPMVVRVAEQAARSRAQAVVVATDDERIETACGAHGVACVRTGTHHSSGTSRLAEALGVLGWQDDQWVVNVQGDEPLVSPVVINHLADTLINSGAPMATVAHPIHDAAELFNPNVVKVVLNVRGEALYFGRGIMPYPRDAMAIEPVVLPEPLPLRHVGMYAYRAGFIHDYAHLAPSPLEHIESLEQLRVLWHGHRIVVAVWPEALPAGVDTAEDLARVGAVFAQTAP